MYSLNSVILLSIYLYFKKKEKSSSSDEPYIMKKNIIKFYSYYYIPFTLHKIKIITKLYLNLFLISPITSFNNDSLLVSYQTPFILFLNHVN